MLRLDGPLNGYQLIQSLQERSEGRWSPSPGSVYPALSQLEDEGLIRIEEQDGRKLFALTDAGRKLVDERGSERPAPWESRDLDRDEVHELARLMREVGSALVQVMKTGSSGQMSKARDVLNTTRRDLYRILADGDIGSEPARGDAKPESGSGADTVEQDS